jgi:hypothetical protein
MSIPQDIKEELYEEFTELVAKMNGLIVKYDLSDCGFVIAALGTVTFNDDDDEPEMDIAFSVNVENEEELDEVLGFIVEGYQHQQRNDTSSIDYWLRKGSGGIN